MSSYEYNARLFGEITSNHSAHPIGGWAEIHWLLLWHFSWSHADGWRHQNAPEAETEGCACREAAVPAQAGGDRRMRDSFSDRSPQTDRFPRNDGFAAAEAMPEGQLLTTLAVDPSLLQNQPHIRGFCQDKQGLAWLHVSAVQA